MYIEHYGLLGRPFQLTPDARFYFDSATHRKAMAYLGYGLSQGEGFIVITGEIGSGKTTLVAHLMQTIDRSRLTAINIVSTQIEAEDMLRSVAHQLSLSTDGLSKAEVLNAVEQALHAEARQGRRVLLIVDEAQNLPFSAIEELRMLSNFQLGPESLVQIFLLGQPEFRDRLNGDPKLEQVRQRVIATHHLEPMGADEIEGYLVHRLAACGWKGNPDFTPEAVSLMHHQSGGVPRLINILAGRVLLHGAIEDLSVIDGNAVRAVLADLGDQEVEDELPFEEAVEADTLEHDYGYDRLLVKTPQTRQPIDLEAAELSSEPANDQPVEPIMQLVEPVVESVEEYAPMNDDFEAPQWTPEADPASADNWLSARRLNLPEEPVAPVEPVAPEVVESVAMFEPEAPTFETKPFSYEAPQVDEPAPQVAEVAELDQDPMADRLAELEERLKEQDAALRRVLTLLVDWAEDERKPLPDLGELKGFAA